MSLTESFTVTKPNVNLDVEFPQGHALVKTLLTKEFPGALEILI